MYVAIYVAYAFYVSVGILIKDGIKRCYYTLAHDSKEDVADSKKC